MDNAVRAHLATLERDGLVEQRGVRRGSGKPAYAYDLTSEAEALFPKAYEPVLRQLLGVPGERLGPQELADLLRAVGQRLARGVEVPAGDLRVRVEAAAGVLNALGGLAELEEADGVFVIRGYSCPLAAVVPEHPQVCQLAAALLAELAGTRVAEHCDRGERPRCYFEVTSAAS